MIESSAYRRRAGVLLSTVAAVVWAATPGTVHASFLTGDALDSFADVMAWVVLIVMPIGAITLFWLIHVMPEKIAHRRHHPQRDAIKTLCLLSLVFGGLLWPIAWLWAYTRPVSFKLAYGTEKHEDYYIEMGDKARAGNLVEHEIAHLRDDLDAMAAKGHLSPQLRALRQDLDALRLQAGAATTSARPSAAPASGPAAPPAPAPAPGAA